MELLGIELGTESGRAPVAGRLRCQCRSRRPHLRPAQGVGTGRPRTTTHRLPKTAGMLAFPLLQHLESTTTSHRQLRPITRVRPRIRSATAQFANGGRHPPHPSHLTLKSTRPQGHLRDLAPTAIVTPRIEPRPLHATVPERRELYRRVDVEENRQPHLATAGSHSSLNRTGLNAFNELKGHMWLKIDESQNSGSRSQQNSDNPEVRNAA